jgi:hypothetical protein
MRRMLLGNGSVNKFPWQPNCECHKLYLKKTPWPESTSKLYQLSDHRFSAKSVSTFADRGCHVVSVTNPYGHILDFLDRPQIHTQLYVSLDSSVLCWVNSKATWVPAGPPSPGWRSLKNRDNKICSWVLLDSDPRKTMLAMPGNWKIHNHPTESITIPHILTGCKQLCNVN